MLEDPAPLTDERLTFGAGVDGHERLDASGRCDVWAEGRDTRLPRSVFGAVAYYGALVVAAAVGARRGQSKSPSWLGRMDSTRRVRSVERLLRRSASSVEWWRWQSGMRLCASSGPP